MINKLTIKLYSWYLKSYEYCEALNFMCKSTENITLFAGCLVLNISNNKNIKKWQKYLK